MYAASCNHFIDAAIVSGYNDGSKVKKGHNGITLWHEGSEADSALNSFDYAAGVMADRWEKDAEKKSDKLAAAAGLRKLPAGFCGAEYCQFERCIGNACTKYPMLTA